MWQNFTIRSQLTIIMTVIVVVIEVTTLFFIFKVQKQENRTNAITEARAITHSLNNDFLKFILTPNADMLADITHRLSAFEIIKGVVLLDESNKPIFSYGDTQDILQKQNTLLNNKVILTHKHLLIKNDIEADSHTFGLNLMDVDLSSFQQRQREITYTILAIFPFALLLGFIISYFLSRSYTRPFMDMIKAMRESSPADNKITVLKTEGNNEIKELFDGFNSHMQHISISTKKLQYQAKHDLLTNVYNRFYIEKKLQEALRDEKSKGHNLLYVDLDQFKLINDSAGMQAGDELLKMVAYGYNNFLPSNGMLARVDGDGFMVLLQNSTKEQGIDFLNKSLEKLKDFRFSWRGEVYSVSASIALIYFEAFQYTLKELIKASNSSLYSAKSQGRNKSYIYDPCDEVAQRFTTELQTAKMIKEALKDGPSRFELFAQKIVPLQEKSDQIGYEILLRLWDKDDNLISPADFLPAAERYQLMADIDVYVLGTYLQIVASNKEHIQKLRAVHINLAGSSLGNLDFQEKVKEIIQAFDFPWEKLEFEVTESSAIGNFSGANDFITYLKEHKISLALDDFGTGMASFEYLKSMPFDVIKIDGSFIKDMHTDPIDKAVIKYIQEIAVLKGQETVAEYVETAQDVEELTKIGVTYGQGFFLGKPQALSSWLNKE